MNLEGFNNLSERQRDILRLRCEDVQIPGIAVQLVVSESTVNNEIRSIKNILDIQDLSEACNGSSIETPNRLVRTIAAVIAAVLIIGLLGAVVFFLVIQPILERVIEPAIGMETDTTESTEVPTVVPTQVVAEAPTEVPLIVDTPIPTSDLFATGTSIAATIIAGQPTPDHYATETRIAADILTQIALAVPLDTPAPTATPTETPTPTATIIAMQVGETWSNGEVELTLDRVAFLEKLHSLHPPWPVIFWYTIRNLSPETKLLDFGEESFIVKDNRNFTHTCVTWERVNNDMRVKESFEPDEVITFPLACSQEIDNRVSHFIITAENISTLDPATWSHEVPR